MIGIHGELAGPSTKRLVRKTDGSSAGTGTGAVARAALRYRQGPADVHDPQSCPRSAGMLLQGWHSGRMIPQLRAMKRPRVLRLRYREVEATLRSWIAQP